MATAVRIYFEGDPKLRSGFRSLFAGLQSASRRITPVPCKANAIADFMDGIKDYPDAVNILLIDSEGPYTPNLRQEVRQHDHWDTASGRQVPDNRLHFMVQVMESWFLADRAALRNYYGAGLAENRLPANRQVEQIPKDDVINGLAAATRDTGKGRYHKTRHAPALLAALNPAQVRAAAPACANLFAALEQL